MVNTEVSQKTVLGIAQGVANYTNEVRYVSWVANIGWEEMSEDVFDRCMDSGSVETGTPVYPQ